MPHLTKQDHLQLIARGRAALETPSDLDAAAIENLIDDLAVAEARLELHDVPWSLDVHVGYIDHRHGTNFYAALSREALVAEIAGFPLTKAARIAGRRVPTFPYPQIDRGCVQGDVTELPLLARAA
jgi:hypothetical protein